MKGALILILTVSSCAFAQERTTAIQYQTGGPGGDVALRAVGIASESPVKGAPYSATITIKSLRTLADGNHIAQTTTGTTARDSQGRTRQEAPLPTGNTPTEAPRLVFILDPETHTSYVLNLTDKTANKFSMPSPSVQTSSLVAREAGTYSLQGGGVATISGSLPQLAFAVAPMDEQVSSEKLGSETVEGLHLTGMRTTRTIPATQVGNAEPINIVTEIWTSSELKTVVYSKLSDPLTGEQIFQLSNIVRSEPDPSLFAVPADFQIVDGPESTIDRPNE